MKIIKYIIIIVLFVTLFTSYVMAVDELEQTISTYEDYKSNFDKLRNDMNPDETDSKFIEIARKRNSQAYSNYEEYKHYINQKEYNPALTEAQFALYHQFSAVFALHLSRVTYFRNKSQELLAEYKTSGFPYTYFEIRFNKTEYNFNRVINVWESNLKRYSNDILKLRNYVNSMDSYRTILYETYGEYEVLTKEMTNDITSQKKKSRSRNNILILVGLISFLIGAGIVYFMINSKTKSVNRDFNYRDIEEDEDINLERGIKKRLDELLQTINLNAPTVSIFMIGASLETALSYLFREIERKDVPDNWTLGSLKKYAEEKLILSSNIKKAMNNILEDRNAAVHDAEYEFEEEDVKQDFSRLKKVIKAVLKAKRM